MTTAIIGGKTTAIGYEDMGRSGDIVLTWGDITRRFWYEFGTGVLVFVSIPDEAGWEKATDIPLAHREEILHFMGRAMVNDRAPGRKYSIEGSFINVL